MKLEALLHTPMKPLIPVIILFTRVGDEWVIYQEGGYGRGLQPVDQEQFITNHPLMVVPTIVFESVSELEVFLSDPPELLAALCVYFRTLLTIEGQYLLVTRDDLRNLALESHATAEQAELCATQLDEPVVIKGVASFPTTLGRNENVGGLKRRWDDERSFSLACWAVELANIHRLQAVGGLPEHLERLKVEMWGTTVFYHVRDMFLPDGEHALMQLFDSSGKPSGRPLLIKGTALSSRALLTTVRVAGNNSHNVTASFLKLEKPVLARSSGLRTNRRSVSRFMPLDVAAGEL